MKKLPDTLREQVRLLGDVLGETILQHQGPALFRKVEEIRALSKSLARQSRDDPGGDIDYQPLIKALGRLPDHDILPLARAFNQFLNLANIADQHYFYGPSPQREDAPREDPLAALLEQLAGEQGKDGIYDLLCRLRIELVLTAHPTEVTRRTFIQKYDRVAGSLDRLQRRDLLDYEARQAREALNRVVEEIWHTGEIRSARPSAVDEAKWGFAVIENSLWRAVPDFLRHLDGLCLERLGNPLPLDAAPLRLFSWMGGDRDGNPNVTAAVTREVLLLGRWKAADLFLQDIDTLINQLSMPTATEELRQALGTPSATPYRDLLHRLRRRLRETLAWAEASLERPLPEPEGMIHRREDLLSPLLLCHRSLRDLGLHHVAGGPLTDTIRRAHAFGVNLLPLDIRQDSDRHVQLFDELTRYLDMGGYRDWPEEARQRFLLEQLAGKRPLLPADWPASEASREVVATCRLLAGQPREILSHYVISMARQPSDVLAVILLLKECGVNWPMPVVPLFETLEDLRQAPEVMDSLWSMDWYRGHAGDQQTVMIGYSDSAKDAGKFAATWALYQCQERLVTVAGRHGIRLKLFHGRGGSIGRGGGPVETAMASQPPGSVNGCIRVTEQGEMIRYKFGMPRVAFSSLGNYVQATLAATVNPAPAPKAQWRELIDAMAETSLDVYRDIVRGHPGFVPWFRGLTPEQELNKLALGSRPARRKADGGIESLRAIPWVFAWTQVRLNLPGWLGVRQALDHGLREAPETLRDMAANWPFFSSFLDLLEMVLGKTDAGICAHYEEQLVAPELHELGRRLRADLDALEQQINRLKGQEELLDGNPLLQLSMAVRKPYLDPLNYLQAELLKRERHAGRISDDLEQALKVTMTGIAAGMRNTG